MSRRPLLALLLAVPLAACAAPMAGRAEPVDAGPTVGGPALEQAVRDFLADDPATAALAEGDVQCPPAGPPDPRVVLFCQVTGVGRVQSVAVTVLDRDGNYRIDRPF